MKILLVSTPEEFDEESIRGLKSHGDVKWVKENTVNLHDIPDLFDEEEKIVALSPVPLDWEIPADIYDKLNNVRYICLVTTSYEFIDLEACKKRNIQVTNIPHYATESVAEYAIFMMLGLLRAYPEQLKKNLKYEFTNQVLGREAKGLKVGIVGLGDIGGRIAELTQAMGMEVFYYSRNKKDIPYTFMELEELVRTVDILFPTITVSPETQKFFTKELLALLKPNALVVNNADTKQIIDHEYLISRVADGTLGGYAFETSDEKITIYKGNIFITGPFGWYTTDALMNNIRIWKEDIIACANNTPRHLIN